MGLSGGGGTRHPDNDEDRYPNPTELYASIKLGLDAHARGFYLGRQLDGATPQPVQKMTFDGMRIICL